jgi:3'-phosphoadenosine 5'-phosphosulfate sulfotransferase
MEDNRLQEAYELIERERAKYRLAVAQWREQVKILRERLAKYEPIESIDPQLDTHHQQSALGQRERFLMPPCNQLQSREPNHGER